MALGRNDPIIVPDLLWTKEKIWEQLDGMFEELELGEEDEFEPELITDEDAKTWVEKEDYYAFEGLTYGDDYYGRNVGELNKSLIRRVLDREKNLRVAYAISDTSDYFAWYIFHKDDGWLLANQLQSDFDGSPDVEMLSLEDAREMHEDLPTEVKRGVIDKFYWGS